MNTASAAVFPKPIASAMHTVLVALLPGAIVLFWQFGWGLVVNIIIAAAAALLTEALLLRCRKLPVKTYLSDYSALVTAALLALALPPYLPWWITVIAVSSALAVGKHSYGGLGNNLFNPAMVGYAVAIIAFPLAMTRLPGADLLAVRFDWQTALNFAFASAATSEALSGVSGATPLAVWRADLPADSATITAHWSNLAFLGGGLWLLYRRIIGWQIPVALLGSVAVGATLLHLINTDYPDALFHLSNGAIMMAAFFIATDPVTAPKAHVAKLIFGGGCGLLLLTFRTNGSYIDGIAFAVLIMNMLKPLLDRRFNII